MTTADIQTQLDRVNSAIMQQKQMIVEAEERLPAMRANLHRLEGQQSTLITQLEMAQQEEAAAQAREEALQAEIAELRAQLAGPAPADPPEPADPAALPAAGPPFDPTADAAAPNGVEPPPPAGHHAARPGRERR